MKMFNQSSTCRPHPLSISYARHRRQSLSFEEQILWKNLRAKRLENLMFRRMYVVEGYLMPFYCISKKIAIEVRGSCLDENGEFDSYKDICLAGAGIRTLRFTNSEVRYQLPKVIQRILDTCSV